MTLTPQAWELAAAAGLPFALLLLLHARIAPTTKRLAAVAASAVVAGVGLYLKGDLTPGNLAGDAVAIFLASQGVYHLLNSAGWIDAIAGTKGAAPAKLSTDDLARVLDATKTVEGHEARLAGVEAAITAVAPIIANLVTPATTTTPAPTPPTKSA